MYKYGLVNSFHSERRIRATVAVLLLAGVGASLLGLVGTGGMAHDFSALFCGFVVYLIHGLLDNVTFSTKPGTVLWMIIGLMTALWGELKGIKQG